MKRESQKHRPLVFEEVDSMSDPCADTRELLQPTSDGSCSSSETLRPQGALCSTRGPSFSTRLSIARLCPPPSQLPHSYWQQKQQEHRDDWTLILSHLSQLALHDTAGLLCRQDRKDPNYQCRDTLKKHWVMICVVFWCNLRVRDSLTMNTDGPWTTTKQLEREDTHRREDGIQK